MDRESREMFELILNRLDKMDCRLDKMESEMSAIKAAQTELQKEMIEVKQKVNDTYELALDAWGQSTENRVWLDKTFKNVTT